MDLLFPCLFCLRCYFLIITPTRHCLPIETIAKWVENSVRFTSAVGTADITSSLKKEIQKKEIKTFSLSFRYHHLTMTVHGSKGRDANYTPQCTNLLFLNNIHKCLRKYCPIIPFFLSLQMCVICLKEFKCPYISQYTFILKKKV